MLELLRHRGHDARVQVAHVEDPDPAREVEVLAAVHVAQPHAARALGKDRVGGGEAARDRGFTSFDEGFAFHGSPRTAARRQRGPMLRPDAASSAK